MKRRQNSHEIIWLWLCALALILFLTLALSGAEISAPMVPFVLIVCYLVLFFLMKNTWEYGRGKPPPENSPAKTSREIIVGKRSRPIVSKTQPLHGNSVLREPAGSHVTSQS